METVAKRGRGRPVTTDPAAVGLKALRLFLEKGIDNVTMDDVAEAAGISRSNLFRIFASKSAVVWGGMQLFKFELARKLEANPETDIVKLLHTSWVEAMHLLDDSLETVRLRLNRNHLPPGCTVRPTSHPCCQCAARRIAAACLPLQFQSI